MALPKLSSSRNNRLMTLYVLALGLFILIFAVAIQVWLAQRLTLWGNEIDTLLPAFRKWRGDHNFWWQIGQYDANPPGDNLLLRLYYRTNVLGWLRPLAEELYWRFPYIALFAFSAIAGFWGAWRWTSSAVAGFFVFLFMLLSPGILIYATEVRFYMWLVFFTTLGVWQFLFTLEDLSAFRRFAWLSIILSFGVIFHVVLASLATLLALGTAVHFAARAIDFWRLDAAERRSIWRDDLKSRIPYWIAGIVPFVIYRIELRYWIHIPPASVDFGPLLLLSAGKFDVFLNAIAPNLPYVGSFAHPLMFGLLLLLLASFAIALFRRNWIRTGQAVVLLCLYAVAPLVLFVSASERNLGLMARHMVFEAPVVATVIVFLVCFGREQLQDGIPGIRSLELHLIPTLIRFVFVTALAAYCATQLSAFAYAMKSGTPSKANIPFSTWRKMYRQLPDRRQLIIVGTTPHGFENDFGNFIADLHQFYAAEFSPSYLSMKGTFDTTEQQSRSLARSIQSEPAKFDFLLVDTLQKIREAFPALPWKSWRCSEFDPPVLVFCRIPR